VSAFVSILLDQVIEVANFRKEKAEVAELENITKEPTILEKRPTWRRSPEL
jgi:hypothetical protein